MIMQLEVASDRGSIRDNKGYLQFKPFPQPPPPLPHFTAHRPCNTGYPMGHTPYSAAPHRIPNAVC